MNNKAVTIIKEVLVAVLTIAIALAIGAVLVSVSGNDPVEAYQTLFRGAFGSKQRMSEVFVKMIPLSMMAFGVSIAFKAQLWNIGGDGQFILGAICGILPGLYFNLPPILLMPLSLVCGMAGGALWAGAAAWLKVRFSANEVITTLMLNYIASYFLSFLVHGPMMDPAGGDFPQSPNLAEIYRLPLFSDRLRIHGGIFVGILVAVVMLFFWKTILGYRIDLAGQGDKVATYSGMNVKRTMIITMMVSGALVGLAGWNEIYGVQYRLLEGLASGYGDIAVVIALLGGLNPLGIVIASFFFSALLVGGATMQRMTEVPYSIVDIIQGLVIVFIIARASMNLSFVKNLIGRRKSHA
ncbi:ABC transporter permease [Lacrimispora sp. 210928-DFI.3.58]|uniref:ABC transporter permease n=1 Tax=Lacrimispora sp. 210928-DFI.3.58 TaxID=2883214 RepID=UPI001D09429A|nr:ABC transporter permease [Lacrimispora sp. 210928-DFI.3.58]MCB7318273.1 ABC transporter permease [Lacrimispora sp. 210928-DFI.3.58]